MRCFLYTFYVNLQKIGKLRSGEFAIVVPTRNRSTLLAGLITNLERAYKKPRVVVIIDSSDDCLFRETSSNVLNLFTIRTHIQSAAQQRNLGLQYIFGNPIVNKVNYISFLDDDVRVSPDYLQKLQTIFDKFPNAVGVSGYARNELHRVQKRTKIRDFIGITGAPGTLTRAAVNISPFGIQSIQEVEWLIGCSSWRLDAIRELRFESDFSGHSLFEDVIFSCNARKKGQLLFDPTLELEHFLESEKSGNIKKHYLDWIKNRYRIFEYGVPNLSKVRFWALALVLITAAAGKAIFSKRDRKKLIGLLLGTYTTMRGLLLK